MKLKVCGIQKKEQVLALNQCGIDYIGFRQSNPAYAGYSDKEIADTLNEGFRLDIHPETDNFLGQFELTFYVNVKPNN